MPEITSTQNPRVKAMRALKDAKTRRKEGLMLIEGEKMLEEARSCGLKVYEAMYDEARVTPDFAGENAVSVAPHVLESISDTVTPQGIIAAVQTPRQPALDDIAASASNRAMRIVALDGVQDPGNLGTIWRTCDAAAFDALLISQSCPDPFSPKVLRSSMGSAFRVPVIRVDMPKALEALRARGCAIVSSQLDGEPFFENLPSGDIVITVGNEARGVSDEVRAMATHRLKLPMPGRAESLNAAVAAGIMIYACISGKR